METLTGIILQGNDVAGIDIPSFTFIHLNLCQTINKLLEKKSIR